MNYVALREARLRDNARALFELGLGGKAEFPTAQVENDTTTTCSKNSQQNHDDEPVVEEAEPVEEENMVLRRSSRKRRKPRDVYEEAMAGKLFSRSLNCGTLQVVQVVGEEDDGFVRGRMVVLKWTAAKPENQKPLFEQDIDSDGDDNDNDSHHSPTTPDTVHSMDDDDNPDPTVLLLSSSTTSTATTIQSPPIIPGRDLILERDFYATLITTANRMNDHFYDISREVRSRNDCVVNEDGYSMGTMEWVVPSWLPSSTYEFEIGSVNHKSKCTTKFTLSEASGDVDETNVGVWCICGVMDSKTHYNGHWIECSQCSSWHHWTCYSKARKLLLKARLAQAGDEETPSPFPMESIPIEPSSPPQTPSNHQSRQLLLYSPTPTVSTESSSLRDDGDDDDDHDVVVADVTPPRAITSKRSAVKNVNALPNHQPHQEQQQHRPFTRSTRAMIAAAQAAADAAAIAAEKKAKRARKSKTSKSPNMTSNNKIVSPFLTVQDHHGGNTTAVPMSPSTPNNNNDNVIVHPYRKSKRERMQHTERVAAAAMHEGLYVPEVLPFDKDEVFLCWMCQDIHDFDPENTVGFKAKLVRKTVSERLSLMLAMITTSSGGYYRRSSSFNDGPTLAPMLCCTPQHVVKFLRRLLVKDVCNGILNVSKFIGMDLGAGTGSLSAAMDGMRTVTCVEIDDKRCETGKREMPAYKWLNMDALDPEFYTSRLGTCDVVISNPDFEVASQFIHIALALIKNPFFACPTGGTIAASSSSNTNTATTTTTTTTSSPSPLLQTGILVFLLPSDFFEASAFRSRIFKLLNFHIEVEYRLGHLCYYKSAPNSQKLTCDSLFVMKPGRGTNKYEHRVVSARLAGML